MNDGVLQLSELSSSEKGGQANYSKNFLPMPKRRIENREFPLLSIIPRNYTQKILTSDYLSISSFHYYIVCPYTYSLNMAESNNAGNLIKNTFLWSVTRILFLYKFLFYLYHTRNDWHQTHFVMLIYKLL